MRTLKSVFGVIGALFPVVYCGGLIYYFFDVSGSWQNAQEIGLGPTLLGLGAVGLLFCIPLIVKIVGIFVGPRSPGRGGPNASTHDAEFDADAVVARYMARRSTDAAPGSPAAPPAHDGGGPAGRPSFGRKVR
jgi:hypothetical protein